MVSGAGEGAGFSWEVTFPWWWKRAAESPVISGGGGGGDLKMSLGDPPRLAGDRGSRVGRWPLAVGSEVGPEVEEVTFTPEGQEWEELASGSLWRGPWGASGGPEGAAHHLGVPGPTVACLRQRDSSLSTRHFMFSILLQYFYLSSTLSVL